MRIKKMIGIFLMSSLMIGLLGGCGSSEVKEGKAKNDGKKKIVLFQMKVEISDQLEAMAEEYEKEKGVEVEIWGSTGDDYQQQIKTKLANNQGPTVFSLLPGAEAEQMSAYLEDLSDLSFTKDIAEGMAVKQGDKIVGIPYTIEGFGMVYNKNLLQPDKITDMNSFVEMMKEKKEQGIHGFGLSQESYFLIGHILNTPFAIQQNPKEFLEKLNAGEVKMADTKEFQEFAKLYAEMRDNSYNPLEVNYDKECGDFATEKTAAIHQGNWCYSMFADYDVQFDMGIMPFPLCGNDKIAVSVPAAWFVNSQASEEEKQAGKEFLEWLYTSETGKNYLMNEFGFLPVVNGMANDKLDPLSKEVTEYTSKGKTIPWVMSDWPAGIVDVYLVPVAQEFFTTKMSPEEFLVKLDQAWEKANEKK